MSTFWRCCTVIVGWHRIARAFSVFWREMYFYPCPSRCCMRLHQMEFGEHCIQSLFFPLSGHCRRADTDSRKTRAI